MPATRAGRVHLLDAGQPRCRWPMQGGRTRFILTAPDEPNNIKSEQHQHKRMAHLLHARVVLLEVAPSPLRATNEDRRGGRAGPVAPQDAVLDVVRRVLCPSYAVLDAAEEGEPVQKASAQEGAKSYGCRCIMQLQCRLNSMTVCCTPCTAALKGSKALCAPRSDLLCIDRCPNGE